MVDAKNIRGMTLVISNDHARGRYIATWYWGGASLDNDGAVVSGERAGELEFDGTHHDEYLDAVRGLVGLLA